MQADWIRWRITRSPSYGPDMDAGELGATRWQPASRSHGKKMQPDFESVIERKIHAWFNYMEGVMHTGQRNQFRDPCLQGRL